MNYVFKYNDTIFRTDDEGDLEKFVLAWVEDHWEAFNQYADNKYGYLTKDNYEAVLEAFFEDNITEE
jgi:hypothetical protein